MSRQTTERYQAYGCSGVVIWIIGLIVGFVVGINSPWAGWIIILVSLLLPFLLFGTIEFLKKQDKEAIKIWGIMCGSIFSVLLLIFLLVFFAGSCSCSQSVDSASIYTFQNYFEYKIKDQLLDPASASFSWSDCSINDDGKTFSGVCHVRSTNVFGAYVTENFTVKGKVENGNLHIEWY